MNERRLNVKVVKWLNTLPNTYAYKRLGGPANKGEPDITGCSHSVRIELEGKVPGGKPTKLQLKKLERWKKAGAITGIFYSIEEAKEIVLRGLNEHKINIE